MAAMLYAWTVDEFTMVRAFGIKKPIIRIFVFAMSIFWASVMIKHPLGMLWVAVNIVAMKVIPQKAMDMARERREARIEENNSNDEKEHNYGNENDA
jgi:hypothetical protein